MQTSVPDLTDLSKEPEPVFELYGPDVTQAGHATPPTACSPAAWPSATCASSSSITAAGISTATCPRDIALQCRDTDQPTAALVTDLKQRGLLDDTLVIWGGEFGRTVYLPGQARPTTTTAATTTRAASRMWMAGGGIKRGHGPRRDRRLQLQRRVGSRVTSTTCSATILHCLGIDHTKLTYRFQGRDFRLTDVHGQVVTKILA